MFKTRKEMQSLIDASRKSLANAEDEITRREKLIEMQRNEIHEYQKENEVLYQENKELRFDNEELSELVRRIKNLTESNSYNNEKNILKKIKELVNDFDSITNS